MWLRPGGQRDAAAWWRGPGRTGRPGGGSRSGPRARPGSSRCWRTCSTAPNPCSSSRADMSSGAKNVSHGSPPLRGRGRHQVGVRAAGLVAQVRGQHVVGDELRTRREPADLGEGLADRGLGEVHGHAEPADQGGPGRVEPRPGQSAGQRVALEVHGHEAHAVRHRGSRPPRGARVSTAGCRGGRPRRPGPGPRGRRPRGRRTSPGPRRGSRTGSCRCRTQAARRASVNRLRQSTWARAQDSTRCVPWAR